MPLVSHAGAWVLWTVLHSKTWTHDPPSTSCRCTGPGRAPLEFDLMTVYAGSRRGIELPEFRLSEVDGHLPSRSPIPWPLQCRYKNAVMQRVCPAVRDARATECRGAKGSKQPTSPSDRALPPMEETWNSSIKCWRSSSAQTGAEPAASYGRPVTARTRPEGPGTSPGLPATPNRRD